MRDAIARLGLLVALAFCLSGCLAPRRCFEPKVESLGGAVSFSQKASEAPAARGRNICVGEVIETGPDGFVDLACCRGCRWRLMPRSKVEFSQVVREAGPPYRVKYKLVLREGAMAGMVARGSGGSHAIEFETSLSAGATQGRAAFIARADGICSVTDGKLLAMPKSWPALTPIEQGESIGAEVTAPGDVKAKPTPPNLAATVRAEMDAFKKRRPPLNQGASEKGF